MARVAFVRVENMSDAQKALARKWVDFGKKVKALRTERGWTQSALVERLADLGVEVHQTTVAKLEAGTRPTPVDEVWALATVFRVSYDELLPYLSPGEGGLEELERALVRRDAAARRVDMLRVQLNSLQREMATVVDQVAAAERELSEATKLISGLRHPSRSAKLAADVEERRRALKGREVSIDYAGDERDL